MFTCIGRVQCAFNRWSPRVLVKVPPQKYNDETVVPVESPVFSLVILMKMMLIWCFTAERPPKVMRRSQRRNNLQICPRRDSNTGGSDLWSNTLPLDHGGALGHPYEQYDIGDNESYNRRIIGELFQT